MTIPRNTFVLFTGAKEAQLRGKCYTSILFNRKLFADVYVQYVQCITSTVSMQGRILFLNTILVGTAYDIAQPHAAHANSCFHVQFSYLTLIKLESLILSVTKHYSFVNI